MIEAAFFGVLGKDGEAKTAKTSGKPYVRLNVRCGDGDAAQWVNVTAFDPQAIEAVDRMTKGARVYIEGRLSLDQWTAADGAQRHGLSCMSWHCRLAQIGRNRPKKPASGRERAAASPYAPLVPATAEHDDGIPPW